jgi:hypothetical protein
MRLKTHRIWESGMDIKVGKNDENEKKCQLDIDVIQVVRNECKVLVSNRLWFEKSTCV